MKGYAPGMTENEQRAERAYRAIQSYRGSREEAAVDIITDILHMLDLQYGLEPETAQRIAWDHFTAEREQ